jgi:hypothetical protein
MPALFSTTRSLPGGCAEAIKEIGKRGVAGVAGVAGVTGVQELQNKRAIEISWKYSNN